MHISIFFHILLFSSWVRESGAWHKIRLGTFDLPNWLLFNFVLFWSTSISSGLIYFLLKHHYITLVQFSITAPPQENLFSCLLAGPLGNCGAHKVNSPLRLKECLQVPIQMVIKKLFNPWRNLPSVTSLESQHQALPHSGYVWTVLRAECVSLRPDRGRDLKKVLLLLCHSLDQLFLIASGRGRFAAVTTGTGDRGALKPCYSHKDEGTSLTYAGVSVMISLSEGSDDISLFLFRFWTQL